MEDTKKIRVRFAPSPTGDLHIGGLRVALFNWLFARQHGGSFILRIEDTDQKRYQPESVSTILEGLTWAGLDWDEGPHPETRILKPASQEVTGSHGLYFQSQRTEIYLKHVEMILAKGAAYRCFCTTERLEQMRKEQETRKLPPMYDKRCVKLSSQEVDQKLKEGIPHVIRLKVPGEGRIETEDLIRGKVLFDVSLVDDQVLLKSDGYPTYHLANVVDDHLMSITHVLRGEDWLSSLPKHILLYQGFGWEQPQFGHLPMILAPDKTKLSKRHGAVSVLALRDLGYFSEALLNFTLLLGWNPGKGSGKEIFSKDEMIKFFSLEGIQKSPAIFNFDKLNWMNEQYIKKMPRGAFTDVVLPHLIEAGLLTTLETEKWVTADRRTVHRDYLEKSSVLVQPRLTFAKDIVTENEYFFDEPSYVPSLLQWKNKGDAHARTHLRAAHEYIASLDAYDFNLSALEAHVKQMIKEKGFGMGDVLWPLRVALTGRDKSPTPFEVMEILGKEESLKRISGAIDKVSIRA